MKWSRKQISYYLRISGGGGKKEGGKNSKDLKNFDMWWICLLSEYDGFYIYIYKNLSNYILNKGNLYINYISINLLKKKSRPLGPQLLRAENRLRKVYSSKDSIFPKWLFQVWTSRMFKKELSDGRKVAENSGEWKFFQRADLGLPKVLSYIHIPVSAEKPLCGLPRGLQNYYEPVTALYLLLFSFRMGVFNVPTLFIDILSRRLGVWWSLGYLVQSSLVLMEMLIYILDSEMEAAPWTGLWVVSFEKTLTMERKE